MTLEGMRERCIRVGSAGKTFSLTGWKVGYATAAPELLAPVAKTHQFLVFTTPPNLQHAVAYGLGLSDDYFSGLGRSMQAKRDRLAAGLARIGFDVLDCPGTYFLNAGLGSLRIAGDDEEVCRTLTVEAGVTTIPISAVAEEGDVQGFLRFCFCKQDEVLDEAVDRLSRFFGVARGRKKGTAAE